MKQIVSVFFIAALVLHSEVGKAQFYPTSALNLSEIKQSGTARFQGLGGNHAALGGDASTSVGNPAGLAFYNRSEVSVSPTLYNIGTNTSYIGNSSTQNKTNLNIGQFALIFAGTPQGYNRRWKRTGLGISYTRLNNLNTQFQYSGTNNRSSFVDYVVENLNRNNVPFDALDKEYNANKNTAQTLDAAFLNLYLFDDTTPQGPPYRKAIPIKNAATNQNGVYSATGFTSQWNIGYSGNMEDKLYIGASLGLWKSDYSFKHELKEQFVNGKPFVGINYNEALTLTGSGINVSVGAIYKATSNLQLGAYLVTPSLTSLTTSFDESVSVSLSGDVPLYDAAGRPVTNAQNQQQFQRLSNTNIPVESFDFNYDVTGPLRASGGITYFFGKYGFITATADYVGYKGMRLSTSYYTNNQDNSDFKTDNKKQVQTMFNNAVNMRVGGEGRLGNYRLRAGVAYLSNPYSSNIDNLDRSRLQFSGGVGFRNESFFIDLASTYMAYKEAYSPYKLQDASRYATAEIKNAGLNTVVSVGLFF
jgi:hypothetical protein